MSIGVHVPFANHQDELFFGKVGIHESQREAVEGQIPGGVPRILPLVRHRDDVSIVQMRPLVVATVLSLGGRRWKSWVAFEPLLHHVVIKLFGPKQSCKRLPHDLSGVWGEGLGENCCVKFLRFALALCKDLIKLGSQGLFGRGHVSIGESQSDGHGFPRSDGQGIMGCRLRADALRVHCLLDAMDNVVVNAVLDVG